MNDFGEVQADHVPESIRHSKRPPASPVKLIEPEVLFPLDGDEVIDGAPGAEGSTTSVMVVEVDEELPFNVCAAVTVQVPSVSVGKTQLVAAFEAATVHDFVVLPFTASTCTLELLPEVRPVKFIVGVTELVMRSLLLTPVSDALASEKDTASGVVYEIRTAPV